MSFIKRARRATVSKAGVAFVTALALGTTSAAVWAATTANATTPDSIWGTSAPTFAAVDSDTGSVELGTKFTAVTAGQATGVRFYKTPENAGSHTGSLWTSTGTLIGKVRFGAETSSGWQVATFATPVGLSAGTSYVVSYHTSYGRYLSTERYTGASTSANLRIPSSNIGVYAYGTRSAFPSQTWHASNYWVDLTFAKGATGSTATPTSGPSTTATEVATTPTSSASSTTTTSASTSATPSVTSSATPSASTTPSAPSVSPLSTTPTATAVTTKASTGSPSATSPSSSISAGLTNCASSPSRCGYPDATNTGIPAGTVLKRVPQDVTSGPGWVWDSRGWIQASSGAVVKNLIVSGSINVAGANITVQNTRILADGESWGIGLQHSTNAVIANNEIGILHGLPRLLVGIKDVYGDCTGTQVLRNNIQNTSSGVQTHEGLIADNYIHDMGYSSGDHINGTTSNGDTDAMTIRHNTIFNQIGQTDAISLFQDFGLEANRVVTDNLIAGGGYTIYGGGGGKGTSYNIKITNNRFSTLYYPNCGSYGPITAFDYNGAGNVLSGNVWDGTLVAMNL